VAVWGLGIGALFPLKGKGLYRDFAAGLTLNMVFGLQFSPHFSTEFSVWGSAHSDPVRESTEGLPMKLYFGQADLRWNLIHGGRTFVPFLLAGFGLGALQDERMGILDNRTDGWLAVGVNFRAGVGLDIHTSRHSLIGLRVTLDNLLFGEPSGDGGTEITCGDTYQLMLGATMVFALRF